jgi:hypothetical protein
MYGNIPCIEITIADVFIHCDMIIDSLGELHFLRYWNWFTTILIKDLNIYNSICISESKYKAAETLDLRKLILDNSIELNDESAIDELIEKIEC